jgi:hypothetical protein
VGQTLVTKELTTVASAFVEMAHRIACCAVLGRDVLTRGAPDTQMAMLSTVSTEDRIPAEHSIIEFRVVVDAYQR